MVAVVRSREGTNASGRVTQDRRPNFHPIRWLLLVGNRRSITLLLSTLILLALLVVGTIWEIEMEILVNETRAVQSLFNTLLGGIILFVSVVLSINTAVLSQEFGPLRTKQIQIEEAIEFQTELERFVGSGISPVDIDGFFQFALTALRTEANKLRDRAEALEDETVRHEVLALLGDLERRADTVESRLRPRNQRLVSTLLAGLDWDAVHHIYLLRRIRSDYEDKLDRSEVNLIANLIEILTAIASGREYFTTLYFKRELRNLSSSLVVLSLPVIVFTAYALLAIDADLFPTLTAFGIQPRLLYISIAFVIALSPYVLLSSYMLRVVTVSKHALSAGGVTLVPSEYE